MQISSVCRVERSAGERRLLWIDPRGIMCRGSSTTAGAGSRAGGGRSSDGTRILCDEAGDGAGARGGVCGEEAWDDCPCSKEP